MEKGSYIVWSELYEHYKRWVLEEYNINANKKEVKMYFEAKVFRCKEKHFKRKGENFRGWENCLIKMD